MISADLNFRAARRRRRDARVDVDRQILRSSLGATIFPIVQDL
jgi:hypothetical protein